MPVKSAKQFRFMEAMAHNAKKKSKGAGPSKAVADDFLKNTSSAAKSKFAKAK